MQVDPAERQRRLTLFAPAFTQLVGLVRGRVAFPHDWNSMQEDDRDDFKHRRQAVADTLVDAACALALLAPPLHLESPFVHRVCTGYASYSCNASGI